MSALRRTGAFRRLLAKELVVLWCTPLPYAAGAVLNATLGLLYLSELQARRQAALAPLVPLAGFLLLILVPVIAARSVAEERRLGTLDVLDAIPVPRVALVLSKWLATALTALTLLLPAVGFAALLTAWAEPDRGPMVTGLVGLALLAIALAAVGVAVSAACTQQAVAALIAVAIGLALWFAHVEPGAVRTQAILGRLSISERLRSFAGGALDVGDVAFFVLVVVLALVVAVAFVVPRGDRRRKRGAWVRAAVALVAVVLVSGRADASAAVYDLTEDDALTLSAQTRTILRAVEGRVRVTALVSDDRGRSEAAALLGRYRKRHRGLTFRVFGPGESPGEVRRLGLDPVLGGVAFEQRDSIERAPDVSEQDLTAALARLVRGKSPSVCVASGHGESDVASATGEGWQRATRTLQANGYRLESIDLLRAPSVPSTCDALVLSSPTSALGAAEAGIASYLAAGGSALVLADPVSVVDLTPIVAPYALSLSRGIVFEGDDARRLGADPVTPVVSSFRSGVPVVRRLPPVFFAGAQRVIVGDSPFGATVAAMGETSSLSYLERDPADEGFDETVDAPGPITLLAAADIPAATNGGRARSRVVVTGDADWATNGLIEQAGHSRLLVQALDWLTLDESLVSVSPNIARLRALDLSPARLRYARVLMSGLVPLLYISAGLVVWALRRRL
ncbi:MAG TPA: GldG family protein [Acidimicrobiales bacterium]|nr:GldG family protein [Acidimicrobiales bacterium]